MAASVEDDDSLRDTIRPTQGHPRRRCRRAGPVVVLIAAGHAAAAGQSRRRVPPAHEGGRKARLPAIPARTPPLTIPAPESDSRVSATSGSISIDLTTAR